LVVTVSCVTTEAIGVILVVRQSITRTTVIAWLVRLDCCTHKTSYKIIIIIILLDN